VARVQREEKIEGITERVFGMKEERENIDLLLERNADEQLSKVDWQRLNAAISSRLDKASRSKTVATKFPTVFKIAAGVAAAAAVILIVMIIRTDRAPDFQLENGRRAVVKFIEAKGSASVEIGHAPAKSQVMVDVGPSQSKLARCDIEIIDANGDLKQKANRATWIIISRPEPVYADNGVSRDSMDMICLF